MESELRHGFVSVPKGCYIQLEKKAAQIILQNIRQSYGQKAGLMSRIASFEEDSGVELSLDNFLSYHHLSPKSIYGKYSFARLCAEAGVRADFDEPIEEKLTGAFSRLMTIDSRRWIAFLLDYLPRIDQVDIAALPRVQQQMLNMFYVTVWQEAISDFASAQVRSDLQSLADSPVMLEDLLSLLRYNFDHIDFIDAPNDLPYD